MPRITLIAIVTTVIVLTLRITIVTHPSVAIALKTGASQRGSGSSPLLQCMHKAWTRNGLSLQQRWAASPSSQVSGPSANAQLVPPVFYTRCFGRSGNIREDVILLALPRSAGLWCPGAPALRALWRPSEMCQDIVAWRAPPDPAALRAGNH